MSEKVYFTYTGAWPQDYDILGVYLSIEAAQESMEGRIDLLRGVFEDKIPPEHRASIPKIMAMSPGELHPMFPWIEVMIDYEGKPKTRTLLFRRKPMGETISRRVNSRLPSKPWFQGMANTLGEAIFLAEDARTAWIAAIGSLGAPQQVSTTHPTMLYNNNAITFMGHNIDTLEDPVNNQTIAIGDIPLAG